MIHVRICGYTGYTHLELYAKGLAGMGHCSENQFRFKVSRGTGANVIIEGHFHLKSELTDEKSLNFWERPKFSETEPSKWRALKQMLHFLPSRNRAHLRLILRKVKNLCHTSERALSRLVGDFIDECNVRERLAKFCFWCFNVCVKSMNWEWADVEKKNLGQKN